MNPLRYDRVTFSYPDEAQPALRDVSLAIPAGVFALATGPTGSGKSTFLRAANGLVPHFSGGTFAGAVYVGARSTVVTKPRDLADTVAFVPQDAAASFVLDRVEDELAYGMENLGVARDLMRRRVEEALDLLAIEPLRDRSVRTLSGGEQQRVAIAAAIAAGPGTLVLDEPTSQLDPQGAEDVLAALQRMVHDHGITVVLAEHRLERIAGFADLGIGVRDGHAWIGPPADVIASLPGGPPIVRLGRALGWDPLPLTVRDARTLAATLTLPSSKPDVGDPVSPGDDLLEAKDLQAGHGPDPGANIAITGIDLTLRQGEIVALMGRNGSGKTTLLRTLAGVHEPIRGTVRIVGEAPHTGVTISLCPQDPDTLLFTDTVADEVRATLRARRADAGDAGDAGDAEAILDAVGIGALAHRHPRELSVGQRMLVAVAAVSATGSPVLLLDEPTRGLDPDSKARLATFLRGEAATGRAVMLSTHDVELAAEIATRVVMLAGGEIIADGDPASVLEDSRIFAPQMTRVFGPGWRTPEQVIAALESSAP